MPRGGKRDGSGRKLVPMENKRVTVTISVARETREKLVELKRSGKQIGRLIDEMVSRI